jgi:hypothetical protein
LAPLVDRRPIDPPPIIQLEIFENDNQNATDTSSFLYNPYYFMYASLLTAETQEELHLLKDGKTRSTTGSIVSSLYRLKDLNNQDGAFFVFPDLSVRMEGHYRLKFSLFEIVNAEIYYCSSMVSDIFQVFPAKKFPGMTESTHLSKLFADQGLRIRIRKEVRNRPSPSLTIHHPNLIPITKKRLEPDDHLTMENSKKSRNSVSSSTVNSFDDNHSIERSLSYSPNNIYSSLPSLNNFIPSNYSQPIQLPPPTHLMPPHQSQYHQQQPRRNSFPQTIPYPHPLDPSPTITNSIPNSTTTHINQPIPQIKLPSISSLFDAAKYSENNNRY